eukprot:CAMPEP_0195519358 /NCGR_PEP_ID=MMETSP0794_2-20130614/14603_1 /TAXON_ID=515487 /ORGANISM="Stephanopyxis turris, Strain CCMP 815" /LENGTH=40 /DNA_ID= /DNA_START= /DNA_END= /DNA_ORIENTATION=
MAQLMAQRYGYDVDISEDALKMKQICGFRKEDEKWDCRLE